jgi:inositol transport system substrate-binding protein
MFLKKKLLVIGILVVTLVFSLFVGCGSKPATDQPADSETAGSGESKTAETKDAGRKKVVGVMIGDFSAQFHAYIMDGMKKEAEKYSDFEFVYVDGKFDSSVQMGQAENFVAQDVDAIIFIPGDAQASTPAQDLINEAGIPLINVNTRLGKPDEVTTFVGSDCIQSGEILMEAVADVMGGKGNILELQGWYGHEPQIERHKGIENVLNKYPDIKVLAEDTGNWSRDEGMVKMENWLQSSLRDQFDAVVAHNDEMAIGAMKAIEAAGMLDKVVVGGIDATPEMLRYLKEGTVEVTVFQDALGQGAKSIEVAVKAVNGETLDKDYMIPYVRVKPEEADKYLEIYK